MRAQWSIFFAAAMAGVMVNSMGCSSTTALNEAPRSEKLASEEEDAVCVSGSLGDGTTCIDYVDIKMDAHALCETSGRVLVDLTLSGECPNGVEQVNYTCCAPQPPNPSDPGNPNSDPCSWHALGDGSVCQTEAAWLAEATQICDADGCFVQGLGLALDCGDGSSSYAKFGCCTDAAPPPPPATCSYHALGDGTTCATDEAWQDQAEQVCAADGFAVLEMGFAHDCADGTSSYAKLACCAP